MALTASTFGGLVSALCLLFFAPQISKVAMKFSSPEYFALAIFGLSVIASVSGKSLVKGLISGGLGILLATVGIDSVSGVTRFTFNNMRLYNGVKMLAILLGVYAIAQMIGRINNTEAMVASNLKKADKDDHITKEDVKKTVPIMAKSSLIGAFIGAIPGNLLEQSHHLLPIMKQREKPNRERSSEKVRSKVLAPESANNGATAATLIPLLTLGIPGDVVAATLLGAFTMHGLVVESKLFETSGPIVYAVLIGCVIAQLIMFFQGKYLLGLLLKLHIFHSNF